MWRCVGRGYGQGSAAVAFSFRAGTALPRGDADGHEAVAGSKRSQINLFGNMQADTGHHQYSVDRLRCLLSRSGHIASNGSTRRVKSLTCYHKLLNLYSSLAEHIVCIVSAFCTHSSDCACRKMVQSAGIFYMIINGVVFVCSITVYKHAGGCGCLVDDLILLCKKRGQIRIWSSSQKLQGILQIKQTANFITVTRLRWTHNVMDVTRIQETREVQPAANTDNLTSTSTNTNYPAARHKY